MLDDLVLFKLETEINRIYAEVETEMVSAIARELAKGSNASSPRLHGELRSFGRWAGSKVS